MRHQWIIASMLWVNNNEKEIMKYYKYESEHKGEVYFRVDGYKDVLKVQVSPPAKKAGRPFMLGVTYVKISTFIQSYHPETTHIHMVQIEKEDFERALEKMIYKFKGLLDE